MKKSTSKVLTVLGLAAIMIAGLLVTPAKAHAQGEQYYFQDSSQKVVIGSNGAYKTALTFVQTGPQAYKGQLGYTCNNQNYTLDLNLSLSGDMSNPPIAGTLNFNDKVGSCTVDPFDKTVSVAKDQASLGAGTPAQSSDSKCDAGSFNWIVCPALDSVDTYAAKIADFVLPPMLQISPLTANSTPGIYQAWKGVRDLANTLLVLAFLVVIFANVLSIQIDSYTLKKSLPRLAIAAIAIQFSFFLAGMVVDLGNVLGAGVGGIISGFATAGGTSFNESIKAGIFNAIGLGTGISLVLVFFPLAIPLALSLLIALAAIFVTLGARFLILYALIVLSPLAFVAWILPNTQSYFSKWWSTFLRLILMYPIIMGIIALAGRANSLMGASNQLATSGPASWSVSALKLVVAIAAFLMIPRTFKWAGGVMASTSGMVNGFASARQKQLRGSQWWKDSDARRKQEQVRRMNQLADTKPIRTLSHSQNALARRAGSLALGGAGLALGGAPSTSLARQRTYSSLLNDQGKQLGDMSEATIGNLQDALKTHYGATEADRREATTRLSQNAPSLFNYTKTQSGRIAMVKQLAENNMVNSSLMDGILSTEKADYGLALQASGKMFSKKPGLLARFGEGQLDGDGLRRNAGEVDTNTLGAVVGGWTAGDIKNDVHLENFKIGQSNREVAQVMADSLASKSVAQMFNGNAPASFSAADKRKEFLMMIKNNAAIFASGKGLQVKDAMLSSLDTDEDFVDNLMLEKGIVSGPAMADKIDAIRSWLV